MNTPTARSTSNDETFEIRKIKQEEARSHDGNGGAPLPLPTEVRVSTAVPLTRNNSIAGQPRTKPRAEGPPVKKKSRPLSRASQAAIYDTEGSKPAAAPNTVRKVKHTGGMNWGATTPPPMDDNSSFLHQRPVPFSPRVKNNKISLFKSSSSNQYDESNSFNHKVRSAPHRGTRSIASGSEGENDLYGEDSDSEFRYGTPLDPTQSAQLAAHMSSLRVHNKKAMMSRNALFLNNSDFVSVDNQRHASDRSDFSQQSSFEDVAGGGASDQFISSQGSFNDGCDLTSINSNGEGGGGGDIGNDELDETSRKSLNEESRQDTFNRLNNRRGSECFDDEEYSDPGVWMNGGGDNGAGVASSVDSEGYSNMLRRGPATHLNGGERGGGVYLDGSEINDNEDSDSLGTMFMSHRERNLNRMRHSDNDLSGSNSGHPLTNNSSSSSNTLTLSEPSVNPFYQVCCPSFLRQTAKPDLGRAPSADYYNGGDLNGGEPHGIPPPPKLAGSTSFAEMFASSQPSFHGGANANATSSFDMMASSSVGSNGWIHDNQSKQPIPPPRRGSQTGGFGNLNFDQDDTSEKRNSDNVLLSQSDSECGSCSQSQEYVMSTPMDENDNTSNDGNVMRGVNNPFQSYMAHDQQAAFTPRAGDSSSFLNGGGNISGPIPISGPTKIFIAPGEIPSRKTVEFEELFELGRGSFGSVSCCRKRTDGVNYAIKRQVLDRMSAAARAVAKSEVYALSALPDCPNLVRYYDAWYEANETLLFVQMEYLPGGTLLCLAERHMLDEEGARRAIRDIARALAYMHGKGIGHLDVKPENILAVGDGGFKLGDLGHATLLDFDSMTPEEGDRSYLLECMPDDFNRDVDLDALPPGAEQEGNHTLFNASVSMTRRPSSPYMSRAQHRSSSGDMFYIGENNNENDYSLSSLSPLTIQTKDLPTPIHHRTTHFNLNNNTYVHPVSNASASSYQLNSNNDIMETSHTSHNSSFQSFHSDDKDDSISSQSRSASSMKGTPMSAGASRPAQHGDDYSPVDQPVISNISSPAYPSFNGISQHQNSQFSNSSSEGGESGHVMSPSYEDETSIGSPVLGQLNHPMDSDDSIHHHFDTASQFHNQPRTGLQVGQGAEEGKLAGPNKNGHAPWKSPELSHAGLMRKKPNPSSGLSGNPNALEKLSVKTTEDSKKNDEDSRKNGILKRSIYLAACDVFALGLGAYEVARMAERPEGYRVPTNGKEYSDLRQGLAPPMVLSAMSPKFSKSYENAVLEVIKPRSYRNRPTAADVLLMFSDPLIEQRFHTSNSVTSLPTMPPPPPRSDSASPTNAMHQELVNLRKRVRELETILEDVQK